MATLHLIRLPYISYGNHTSAIQRHIPLYSALSTYGHLASHMAAALLSYGSLVYFIWQLYLHTWWQLTIIDDEDWWQWWLILTMMIKSCMHTVCKFTSFPHVSSPLEAKHCSVQCIAMPTRLYIHWKTLQCMHDTLNTPHYMCQRSLMHTTYLMLWTVNITLCILHPVGMVR